MYRCESWTIKKAECQRIDAFDLWCWRRLLRVSWIARRSNKSILEEINPEYSLEGLMLKLKLQYHGHLIQRVNSLEKTPMLGKIEGRRGRWWQRMRQTESPTQWTWASSRSLGNPMDRGSWWATVHGVARVRHNLATKSPPGDSRKQRSLVCYSPWGC